MTRTFYILLAGVIALVFLGWYVFEKNIGTINIPNEADNSMYLVLVSLGPA